MKTPPFLLGAALLFWGGLTGYWLFAGAMAIVAEGARLIPTRWELSLKDLQRVADLCSVIFVGTVVYHFTVNSSDEHFFPLRWLPLSFFPLLIAQLYGTVEAIDLRVLFWLLRNSRQKDQQESPQAINLTYPYGAVCILAAGVPTDMRTAGFYLGTVALCAWALLITRSSRYSLIVWGLLIVLAVGTGYGTHVRMRRFQMELERNATLITWLRYLWQEFNPYMSSTAIGSIGSLKLSDEVVCRVKMLEKGRPALLLREASYTIYHKTKWHAPDVEFTRKGAESDDTTWILRQNDVSREEKIIISEYLTRGKGILKVPLGTFQLRDLIVGDVYLNPYGAIKVEEGPGLVKYQASFDLSQPLDTIPVETDLVLPADDEALFQNLAAELDLISLPPAHALREISTFFSTNFSYSLDLVRDDHTVTPLADFLDNVRSGHCEYFATATVLLLRAAGIPARYAIGYSVAGLPADRWTLVRGSDAHAWAQVYLNGRWQNFDTTPSSWRAYEEARTNALLQWLKDAWADITFAFSEWRWRQNEGGSEPYLFGLLGILVIILVWRLYRQRRTKVVSFPQGAERQQEILLPGLDSAFYLIEKRLQETGLVRRDWEPLALWLQRINTHTSPQLFQELAPILALHYQYRFDPHGLSAAEKTSLQQAVQAWLELHPAP